MSYSESNDQVILTPLDKWRREYFSAGISHEMWPKAVEDAFNAGAMMALDKAIDEVATGRTINNFGHVPSVRRALEWVIMDLQSLKGEAEK
jgi:hypothetical protein